MPSYFVALSIKNNCAVPRSVAVLVGLHCQEGAEAMSIATFMCHVAALICG